MTENTTSKKIDKVVGIDLGTTNSVIAVLEGGLPNVVPNTEGLRTTPSIVAYTKKRELLVGQIAKRQAVINPENTFYSIKRFIGSKFDEIKNDSFQVPYELKADTKGNIKLVCSTLEKEFSPEEISAQVLRKLTSDAELYLQKSINKAVITVPAYFNDSQRQATKDAGNIAGLEVLRIINEPTAASLAYGLDKKDNETVLVFDLGGGTFDVSILEVGEGVFEVLATSGDTHLGGDDFDAAIVKFLLEDFKSKEGIDLAKEPQALQRLTEAAEKAKMELSTVFETSIHLPFITGDQNGPKHIETTLTRDKFESLCKELIMKCRIPVESAIKDAKINKNEIDEVVMVGGSTRIPAIENLVKELSGKTPNQTVNPDEVVALGAAVQGAVLAGEITDLLLLDVTPLALGVDTVGGLMSKIIPRNTTIPTKKTEGYSTAADNQTSVQIKVFQGERDFTEYNRCLGEFDLGGLEPAPRGVPQVEVTFDIDVDGILSVKAKEKTTQKEQAITITNSTRLDKEDIDRMIKDAEASAEADKLEKRKIELLNQGNSLKDKAQTQIDNLDSLDKENNSELIEKIEKAIEELSQSISNKNTDLLEGQIKTLEGLSFELNSILSNKSQ